MGCVAERSQATLEGVSLKFGRGHSRNITAIENAANVLAGKYLPINYFDPQLSETLGYIWFSDGVAVDPAPAGLTLIGAVSVTSGDSAAVVAAAIKVITDAYTDGSLKPFKPAVVTGDKVCLENRFIGEVTAEADPDMTGFTLAVELLGVGVDLGLTSEAVSLSSTKEVVQIQANQTASLVLDEILTGESASITGSFIEITKAKYDVLQGIVAGDFIEFGDGTKFTGAGENKLFQSLLRLGGQLILHPIRLEDTDYSEDIIFWKTAPKLNTENLDGAAVKTVEIEFIAYLDSSKKKEIRLYGKGDWTRSELDV